MYKNRIWAKAGLVAEVRAETESRIALLQLDTDQPVVLEEIAAVIWMKIDGHRSESEIVADIEHEFVTTGQAVGEDVTSFIRSLADHSLIVQVTPVQGSSDAD